eukprot:TRINITY_DN28213_c0_g1_i2.p1 TRINITY_DN28213_c0_g1~~TRINITY_DN28213_c0_g1_i2.p1  ORF type:complete len:336 (-),score=79.38 TRINITY_DN28213_c0_g1_i2:177-1184(-)
MLRSLVGSEMCIRDSINAEYGEQAMGGCNSSCEHRIKKTAEADLVTGVDMGRPGYVTSALSRGADPNHHWGPYGQPALIHCLTQPVEQRAILEALLGAGASVCEPDNTGQNTLHWIALAHDLDRFHLLRELSEPVSFAEAANAPELHGMNALHIAIHNPEERPPAPTEFLQELLTVVDPSISAWVSRKSLRQHNGRQFEGWTPLCFAAAAGSEPAMSVLVQDKRLHDGPRVLHHTSDGLTAFDIGWRRMLNLAETSEDKVESAHRVLTLLGRLMAKVLEAHSVVRLLSEYREVVKLGMCGEKKLSEELVDLAEELFQQMATERDQQVVQLSLIHI